MRRLEVSGLMKARWLLIVPVIFGVLVFAYFVLKGTGAHYYYPPVDEIWINIGVGTGSVQETVLWTPLTPANADPSGLSCLQGRPEVATTTGDHLVTREYSVDSPAAIELNCDVSAAFAGDGVSKVRVLVAAGDDSDGSVTVISSEPQSDGLDPPAWWLTANRPALRASVRVE